MTEHVQLEFPDPGETRRDQMEQKAREFHQKHPEVWTLFCRFAFEMIRTGRKHYSADAVMHRVRWETDQGRDFENEGGFKISNNHVAFYSRWFMACYPQHDGFFRTCKQTSEDRAPKDWLGPEDQ